MKKRTCKNNTAYWATPQEDREDCQIQVQRKKTEIQLKQSSINENQQKEQNVNSEVVP